MGVYLPLLSCTKFYPDFMERLQKIPWRNWLGSINYISFKFVAIFSAFVFPIALTINHILNSIKFFFVFYCFFDSLLFQFFLVPKTRYQVGFHGLGVRGRQHMAAMGVGPCGSLRITYLEARLILVWILSRWTSGFLDFLLVNVLRLWSLTASSSIFSSSHSSISFSTSSSNCSKTTNSFLNLSVYLSAF